MIEFQRTWSSLAQPCALCLHNNVSEQNGTQCRWGYIKAKIETYTWKITAATYFSSNEKGDELTLKKLGQLPTPHWVRILSLHGRCTRINAAAEFKNCVCLIRGTSIFQDAHVTVATFEFQLFWGRFSLKRSKLLRLEISIKAVSRLGNFATGMDF